MILPAADTEMSAGVLSRSERDSKMRFPSDHDQWAHFHKRLVVGDSFVLLPPFYFNFSLFPSCGLLSSGPVLFSPQEGKIWRRCYRGGGDGGGGNINLHGSLAIVPYLYFFFFRCVPFLPPDDPPANPSLSRPAPTIRPAFKLTNFRLLQDKLFSKNS